MTALALLAFAGLTAPLQSSTTPERFPLEGTWQLTQAERGLSLPAKVPGVVHTDLIRAGTIPDPFLRDRDKEVQWVGETSWTYSRSFTVPAAFLSHREIRLRCEGLDTLAKITVNGQSVGNTDNMFRTWEFDVRPLLKAGENRIEITFSPIEPYLRAHVNQAAFPGKPVQGWGYIRKPPFQQGWDFSPKLITSGIWRGIGLVGWDAARLTDFRIDQDHHTKTGQVGLSVGLQAETQEKLSAKVEVRFKGRRVASGEAPMEKGGGKIALTLRAPKLWWPKGLGAPNLYDVRVELRNDKGQVVDRSDKRIGLRTVTWIAKTEKTPLTLAINGHRFFAKGSNWVPRDALPGRATPEEEQRMVREAVAANMNMLRLWGGGHYESDAFYDACDENGLLVWFEFKFADAAYPAFDPAWMANVRAEAEDNVRRVRHHPSVAVWSGNNEVIGFIGDTTGLDRMSREDYQKLFHHELADVVHSLTSGAAYTPGSPEIGDEHDWSVWHGSSGFESYRDVHGFLSEFGFQAFPTPQSVGKFTEPSDRTAVSTPVMKSHQRNWRDGNQLIVNTMKRYYHKPKDFESTLWLSQIQQAEGVLMGVEHWRRDWPNSTGSLVWQFNDCWPSISWAMVDYYGQPKALYYRLRHAYAPVALSGVADAATGVANLWVANDRPESKTGTVEWTLMRTNGQPVRKGTEHVAIPAGTSSVRAATIAEKATVDREGAGNLLLWAKLSVPGETPSTAVLWYVRPKEINLVDPGVVATVTPDHGAYKVTLKSRQPALWTWVELSGLDAHFSDNFVHLRPGEAATILVEPRTKIGIEQVRTALRVRSLFDTYAPGDDYETPITVADADGTIRATAPLAEIVGDTAMLEDFTPNNIGNWSDPNDKLRWVVKNVQPGTYSVTVNLSSPPNGGGSKFELDIAGQVLRGEVPLTSSWTDYRDLALGQVRIAKGGTLTMLLSPKSKVTTHVMNLRSVTLKKISD